MSLTKISNNSLSAISTLPASIPTGALTLLSTQTASASASIEFTSGIDSTYDSYVFKFINIHAGTSAVDFTFQASTDGGSTYGVTTTSTAFRAYHQEDGVNSGLGYITDDDLAQSTSFQVLSPVGGATALGTDNDSNLNGTLQIFSPSSNTFVKHFITRTTFFDRFSPNSAVDGFTAGYFNDGTNDINAVQFKMSSGNIDDGIIKMYGVK